MSDRLSTDLMFQRAKVPPAERHRPTAKRATQDPKGWMPPPVKGMGVHRFIHKIWKEVNEQRTSQRVVAEKAGVDEGTLRKWRTGQRSPQLMHIEAVLNVLGYKIVLVPIGDDGETHDEN